MDIYIVERHISHIFQSGEHHSYYPEEDDIVACYQHICRVEVFKFRSLFRPSQSGERPQSRAEPCIKNILVLMDVGASALRAFFRLIVCNNHFTALVAVVCRNSVSPPELTGNTPVSDFLKPVQISFFESFRNVSESAVLCGFYGRFSQFFHGYEPLIADHILDYGVASVAFSHRNNLFLGLNQIACFLKVSNPVLTTFIAVLSLVLSCQSVHGCVLVDAGRASKSCTQSNFKVVRVVSRGNLYCACSLFRIRIHIGNDRNFLAYQRQDNLLSY